MALSEDAAAIVAANLTVARLSQVEIDPKRGKRQNAERVLKLFREYHAAAQDGSIFHEAPPV